MLCSIPCLKYFSALYQKWIHWLLLIPVFMFFLLLLSPLWLSRCADIVLTCSAGNRLKLSIAGDAEGGIFSIGKLRINTYEIPGHAASKQFTLPVRMLSDSIRGLYLKINSSGNESVFHEIRICGSGTNHRVDFTRELLSGSMNKAVKVSKNAVTIRGFEAVLPIKFPEKINIDRKIDWIWLLYSILLALIPTLLFQRLTIQRDPARLPELIFSAAVLLLLVLPVMQIDYFSQISDENRLYAPFPSFWKNMAVNDQFPKELENWLNDRFYLREKLLDLNQMLFSMNWLKGSGGDFSDLDNKRALRGKDQWMFTKFFDSVAMMQNKNRFSDAELQICAENLVRLQQAFQTRCGAKTYILLTPDKERVYEDFYPDFLLKRRVHSESRLEQLYRFLKQNTELNLIYPLPKLLEAKKHYPVYYKTGSHWTPRGAGLAANLLLDALRKDFPDLPVIPDQIVKWKKRKYADVDIAKDLGFRDPLNELPPDMVTYEEPVFKTSIQTRKLREDWESSIFIFRYTSPRPATGNGKGIRMLVLADSFWGGVIPFVHPYVQEQYHIFYGLGRDFVLAPFAEEIEKFKPDAVVIQTTERFLHRFLTIHYEK